MHPRPAIASLAWVAAQFAALGWLLFTAPVWQTTFLLLIVQAVGFALMLWAAATMRKFRVVPEVHREARLTVAGPYRWVRHPMYAGLLLMAAAWTAAFARWDRLLALLLLAIVLSAKARREERLLAERFPDYAAYAARTGRFLPGFGKARSGAS